MLKRCRRCGNHLPVSDFFRNRRSADGLSYHCKTCYHAYYVANREANKEARLERNAKYRREHPEKLSLYAAKWRAANPEAVAAFLKAYRSDGRAAAADKRWYDKNKAKLAARRRTPESLAAQRERNRRYAKRHPERQRERDKKRRSTEEFKLTDRVAQSNRRARKRALPGKYSVKDIERMLAVSNRCHICKKTFTSKRPPTVDHVMPSSSSLGSNDPSNLTLVCGSCNSRKKDSRRNPLTGQGLLV